MIQVLVYAADPDLGPSEPSGRRLWVCEWTDSDGSKRGQLSLVPLADLEAYWHRKGRTVRVLGDDEARQLIDQCGALSGSSR